MIEPILYYGKLRLLNVPGGKPVYDEVLVEDCYRRNTIPEGSIVIDVGGFYGEFGWWCSVEKGCEVYIYEPSRNSYSVATANYAVNKLIPDENVIENLAVSSKVGHVPFLANSDHPSGSKIDESGEYVRCTTVSVIMENYNLDSDHGRKICVKLDCEGAEREIFEDESWIDSISWLAMEWHNKDGHRYRDILKRHGFTVELDQEDPEVVRGVLWAIKK